MKKIILGLSLVFLGTLTYAQGLDSIIVEKYYISNAADATGSTGASAGTLPIGSVTYRVYADLKPGYSLQAIFGNQNSNTSVPIHTLLLNTTTTFFNSMDRGNTTANAIGSQYLKNNSNALDSWFSVGAAAAGQMGILKSEDNGVANLLLPHSPSTMLTNTVSTIGIPLTAQDGMVAGTPLSVTTVGLNGADSVFNDGTQNGNSFLTTNGSIASLSVAGAQGPDSTTFNRLLIGQFTTDGVFHFELNIQIGNGTVIETYGAKNLQAGEFTDPSLTYTSLTPNVPPTVSITAPVTAANYLVGDAIAIAAAAADTDGTIDSVGFFMDGIKIGTDVSSPYTFTVVSTLGTHTLTAVATDNNGAYTTSAAVIITVLNTGSNLPPTVSITAPLTAATFTTGATVAIAATAADADGTVSSVQFFVDGVSIGTSVSSPYTSTVVSTVGTHTLTAIATDNGGAHTTSAAVTIIVSDTTTGIADLGSSGQLLNVYPNPADDFITIEINTLKQSVAVYSIYDATGNIMLTNKLGDINGNYLEKINVSSFTSGQYILELSLDGVVSTKKIIKN